MTNHQKQLAASTESGGNFAASLILSIGSMIALISALIYHGGIWDFLASTRLLDIFVKAGIIQYHDRTQGLTHIPDPTYYLKSQDPIRWEVIAVVVLLFFLTFALKALQLNGVARILGMTTSLGQNFRAYCYGHSLNSAAPFGFGNVAASLALANEGMPLKRAKAAVFVANLFELFEILMFAAAGLLLLGWSIWLAQVFWSLLILAIAIVMLRKSKRDDSNGWTLGSLKNNVRHSVRLVLSRPLTAAWLALLSLSAFFLHDLCAYFIPMGFSATHVFLMVDFNVVLMAVVAYHIATLVRFTPGGIGQGEWAMAAALWVSGVGFPECATIAILHLLIRLFCVGCFHFLVTKFWRGSVRISLAQVTSIFLRRHNDAEPDDKETSLDEHEMPKELPEFGLARAPRALTIWKRFSIGAAIFLGLFFLDKLTLLLFDFWLLKQLNLASVFWTNFSMGAWLFVIGFVVITAAVALPALLSKISAEQRALMKLISLIAGLMGGYWLMGTYQEFLIFGGRPFGEVDPVYGKDLGFYVYDLDNWWSIWSVAVIAAGLSLLSAIVSSCFAWLNAGRPAPAEDLGAGRFWALLTIGFGKLTYLPLAALGLALAWGEWLSRYSLLFKYNEKHVLKVGATLIDVEGFLSNRVYVYATAIVILGLFALLLAYLKTLNAVSAGKAGSGWQGRLRTFAQMALLLVILDFGFKGLVAIRDWIFVRPNEPVIQLEYTTRHIEATRKAYGLDRVQEVAYVPAGEADPAPDIETLLKHPTIRNAPLWPGFTSYLEGQLDPQHSLRILQTQGDKMVYGPTMEIFFQQQKLRAYYNFLGIDSVRYNINGEKKMFTSAVREVPLVEPQPWLSWWGQRFMLFTHGYGLVMAEAAQANSEGEPNYVSSGIDKKATYQELQVENPRIYYGEGSGTMAFSNIRDMKELDYPTDQGRAELWLPEDSSTGVPIDSLAKRLAFGWRSGQFMELVFSDLITNATRVHYFRTPLERLDRIASFLYYDNSSMHAATVDGKVIWVINGLTTSDDYPYSMIGDLGDKSDERSRYPRPHRWINYVEDSVKATVDAASGEVHFYKISDDPVIASWAKVYPDLFRDGSEMPSGVRAQLTYPTQLFHLQFDDHYIYYHMKDPMYFFNMEDMFDDADEVLGPMMDNGAAIRFSTEPQSILVETGGAIPEAKEKLQYTLTMPFTSEKAWGLRAIPMAYQDGEDYGRLVVLMIPKDYFFYGTEQADAAIDQNPNISRDFSLWSRLGSEVIRGHTSTLMIGNEVIFVEPIFIRSQQTRSTQLKRVAVVFRGIARMGETLEEALREAIKDYQAGERNGKLPMGDQVREHDEKSPREIEVVQKGKQNSSQ